MTKSKVNKVFYAEASCLSAKNRQTGVQGKKITREMGNV